MNMKISGEVVRRLKVERGWTQEHLAALTGTNVRTIQRVESTGTCALETRSALAATLEIDLKQLDGVAKIEQARGDDTNEVRFYHRLTSGHAVVQIFQGAYWYRMSNEEPRSREDVDEIAGALQDIHDWSEIWADIESGSKVKAAFELGELLKNLESHGLWLFGLRTSATFPMPDGRSGKTKAIKGNVCNMHLAYANSERIIVLDPTRQMPEHQ